MVDRTDRTDRADRAGRAMNAGSESPGLPGAAPGGPPGLSNDEWVAAVRGRDADGSVALDALRASLRRILGKTLRGRVTGEDLDDLVQEALSRVVENVASFRGDSAFTSWAAAVAIRVGFTELRQRAVRGRHEDPFAPVEEDARWIEGAATASPDAAVSRKQILAALENAIATRLTERQRVAVLAELRGLPTVAIAERLNTNTNALYKLVHDARRNLRRALEDAGFSAESIRDLATERLR